MITLLETSWCSAIKKGTEKFFFQVSLDLKWTCRLKVSQHFFHLNWWFFDWISVCFCFFIWNLCLDTWFPFTAGQDDKYLFLFLISYWTLASLSEQMTLMLNVALDSKTWSFDKSIIDDRTKKKYRKLFFLSNQW